jgi:homoaconitase
MERDNVTSTLEDVGAVVLANACGPCIGQVSKIATIVVASNVAVVEKRRPKGGRKRYVDSFPIASNSLYNFTAILTSFNRNFKSRNDGNKLTMNFLASPTIVTAMAFSGKLSFNPMTDSLALPSGEKFRFSAPSGQDLPSAGFIPGETAFYPRTMPPPQPDTEIVISKDSQRLELLEPFASPFPHGKLELPPLKVLMRVRGKYAPDHSTAASKTLEIGKCTTDHISAAVRTVQVWTWRLPSDSLNRAHG